MTFPNSQSHWQRLDDLSPQTLRFMSSVAAFSHLPDGVLSIVFEDDRLLRVIDEVETEVLTEFTWLQNLPDLVWSRLSRLCGGIAAAELRSDSIACSATAIGFLWHKVLAVARAPPWALAVGDIRSNIRAVLEGKWAHHDIVMKLERLLKAGAARIS